MPTAKMLAPHGPSSAASLSLPARLAWTEAHRRLPLPAAVLLCAYDDTPAASLTLPWAITACINAVPSSTELQLPLGSRSQGIKSTHFRPAPDGSAKPYPSLWLASMSRSNGVQVAP